mmetsp:Transcript_11942/g.17909  ORF Transcript_11942/g.17909 Transcript_11942/m.17909 type:complete len:1083 (-) Transcript_11942:115-3363(-)
MAGNQQESFMAQVLSQPGNYQQKHIMAAVAIGRWLNVSEIESLLDHANDILSISTAPPASPPSSGTLLLFNRSITRNYKDDGHQWIRKRNSNKVREDHVKLRVGGKFRVSGCYVHSSGASTFHRRAYHLLNPDSGTALYPVTNASKAGKGNLPPSLILVHYLDTKVASSYCANLVDKGIDINPTLYPNIIRPQHAMATGRDSCTTNYGSIQPQAQQSSYGTTQQDHDGEQYQEDPGQPDMCVSNERSDGMDYPISLELDDDDEANDLESKAIDFLWDVVVEDGNDDVQMRSSNLSDLLTPELIEKMFDSEMVGSLFEHGELFHMSQSEMNVKAKEVANYSSESGIEYYQDNTKPAGLIFGQEAAIPGIADITPEVLSLDAGPAKLVLSCTDSAASTLDDSSEQFVWERYVCVVGTSEIGAEMRVAKIIEAKMLNPYCYQCTVPERSVESGDYKVMVIAVKLDAGVRHSRSKIHAVIHRMIDALFAVHKSPLPASCHSITFGGTEMKILTQLSSSYFTCTTVLACDHTSANSTTSSGLRKDLPAPPAAMALVATMLSDFPNPPAGAVLPPDTVMTNGTNFRNQNGITFEEAKESTSNSHAEEMFSNAMEATVRGKKKRSNSVIEIPRTGNVNTAGLEEGPTAASQWMSQMSNDLESDTTGDAVDRHCKIRFVERLTNVISEAEGDHIVRELLPENITNAVDTAANGDDGVLTFDHDEMKALDDDELDHILDSVLVRIVECLVEVSASECDIQEELNAPDESGFTLLHYAALYNLQSLIPVLLSRGSHPDVKSTRGDVTPLHLACGAGNNAIVDLLLRQGCAIEVPDCFGSFPADHAVRNGFHALAAKLQGRILDEKGITAKSSQRVIDENIQKKQLKDFEKMRLQEAFANLSLKDKLALNILFKKSMKGKQATKNSSSEAHRTIVEVDNESDCESENNDDGNSAKPNEDMGDENDQSKDDSDDLGSVITDTDKESLDIAMKLMNAKELEDLEKSASVHQSLKEWMIRRNYESLKEASEHLQNTIKDHKEKGGHIGGSPGKSSPTVEEASKMYAKNATIRSLKNVKSQAIAALVLRKNIKDSLK